MEQGNIIYKNILENMSDGVMTIDLEGRIITFNRAAESILGIRRDDILNKAFGEVFLMLEGNDEFNQSVLDAVYESETIHNKIVDFNAEKKTVALEVTTSFLKSRDETDNKNIAVIVVFNDITEIKKLRDAERQLTDEIKANHKNLQDAYLKIEDSNDNLKAALKKVQIARISATIFVVLLFVGIGLYSWNTKSSFARTPAKESTKEVKDPSKVQTYTVVPRPISSTLSLSGALKPLKVVNITSPFTGKVEEKFFQYGQVVQKGQLLLKMNTYDVEMQHRETKVAYIRALEKVNELENWESSSDASNAKRVLSRAKMNLQTQKSMVEEVMVLYDKGIVPLSEHENAKLQLINAEMDYESAQEALESTIARGSSDNINIAKLEFENAKNKFEELEEQLKRAEINAPISGTVIRTDISQGGDKAVEIEKGIEVNHGGILISIANLEGLSVDATVDEVQVMKIRNGQKVIVTGDAFPGLVLDGKVFHVSAQAGKGQGYSSSPSFDVMISIENLKTEERERVRLGMSANLELVVYEKPDALLIPIHAVTTGNGERIVRIINKNSGEINEIEVKTGVTTLDSVEILEGLSAGNEVVVGF